MANYRLHYFPESGNSIMARADRGDTGLGAPYDLLPGQCLRCYV